MIAILFFVVIYDILFPKVKSNFWFYVLMIGLSCLAGFRYKVGGDTLGYNEVFDRMFDISYIFKARFYRGIGYEPFFLYSMGLVKYFTNEFWVYQMIHAIFFNFCIFNFIKKYCKLKYVAVLLYYYMYFVYFNMEIMREAIVIGIFLLLYPKLERRQIDWKYYLIAVIALLFHTSGLILFLFPLLTKMKFSKKNVFILAFVNICIVAIFMLMPDLLKMVLFNDQLSMKFESYSAIVSNIKGTIFNIILFIVLPYICIKLNRGNDEEKFDNMKISYFFFASIFCLISGFGRFINYFGIFMIVYFANTLFYLSKNYKFSAKRFAFVICGFAIITYYKATYYLIDYTHLSKDAYKYSMYYPYGSIFEKKEDKHREQLWIDSMWESFNPKDKSGK